MIRCLVVDDSPTFRAVMRALLAAAREVEVVGEAADGDEAVAKVLALRPDVVTMDVRMPGKDGLAAIDEIMRAAPTPVIVVTAEGDTERQEIAFWALELGAIEVLAKPRADLPGRFQRDAEAIRAAVRAVSGLKLVTRHHRPRLHGVRLPPLASRLFPGARGPRALAIASSTGGPAVLARIVRALPPDFALPILVVQHIAPGFESGLVHWLQSETRLAVKSAEDGEAIRPGTVYLAPGGHHLVPAAGRVSLVGGPPVRGFRPSGTTLLEALAREYGPGAAGLVLSGMGDDGAAGLAAVRERGGWTAAQGPASSAVFGMPRVAIERGAARHTLEADEIAPALVRLAANLPAA